MQCEQPTFPAAPTHALEPHPVSGWVLEAAIVIDAVSPGYLAYLCQASELKRQSNFLALAVVHRKGAEHVTELFRNAGLYDCHPGLDAPVQIARVLVASRARDICRALTENPSFGLLGVLHRIGKDALPRISYGRLIELTTRPQHRERVSLLRHVKHVTASTIEIACKLPPSLLRPEVITRLRSAGEVPRFQAVLDLIRDLNPNIRDAQIWQSLQGLAPPSSLEDWAKRWMNRAERFNIQPPRIADPEVRFLSSAEAMRFAGRTLRNCLSQKISLVALERAAFFLCGDDAVVELEALSGGFWVLTGIHGPRNLRLPADRENAIRQAFQKAGVLVPAAYSQSARLNLCARYAGQFDVRRDFFHEGELDLENLSWTP